MNDKDFFQILQFVRILTKTSLNIKNIDFGSSLVFCLAHLPVCLSIFSIEWNPSEKFTQISLFLGEINKIFVSFFPCQSFNFEAVFLKNNKANLGKNGCIRKRGTRWIDWANKKLGFTYLFSSYWEIIDNFSNLSDARLYYLLRLWAFNSVSFGFAE